jgi:hypothetical protein
MKIVVLDGYTDYRTDVAGQFAIASGKKPSHGSP